MRSPNQGERPVVSTSRKARVEETRLLIDRILTPFVYQRNCLLCRW
jgi:hypothetical protein